MSPRQPRPVSARVEELDGQQTPMGEISLRRRREPTTGVDVYEVRLGEEYLMSSLFTVAEEQLALLALAELDVDATDTGQIDVVVGGLGLGFTARTVLLDPRVRSLDVVEALPQVVQWQERGLLPGHEALTGDPRCRLVVSDFFARIADGAPFATGAPDRVHALVVDIDHTPRFHLHPSHAPFYEVDGLRRVADRLHPGGVFALWSDTPPDGEFSARLDAVFATAAAHVVPFANSLTGGTSRNTVYLARTGAGR